MVNSLCPGRLSFKGYRAVPKAAAQPPGRRVPRKVDDVFDITGALLLHSTMQHACGEHFLREWALQLLPVVNDHADV